MSLLLRYWKELLIALQLIVIYVGYKTWPKPVKCEAKVEVVEKVVYKDKIVYVDRVVTRDRVITKPDGTKIEETTRTEESKRKEEKKKKDENKVDVQVPVPPKPQGIILAALDPLAYLQRKEYVTLLGGGLRLGNTPLLLTVTPSINLSKPKLESIFIGITWEID